MENVFLEPYEYELSAHHWQMAVWKHSKWNDMGEKKKKYGVQYIVKKKTLRVKCWATAY